MFKEKTWGFLLKVSSLSPDKTFFFFSHLFFLAIDLCIDGAFDNEAFFFAYDKDLKALLLPKQTICLIPPSDS